MNSSMDSSVDNTGVYFKRVLAFVMSKVIEHDSVATEYRNNAGSLPFVRRDKLSRTNAII